MSQFLHTQELALFYVSSGVEANVPQMGGIMIQIKELTINHRKDLRVIIEDFHCILQDGDKAVLIGEEGNGKSTLMKWLYDPKLVEDYAECSGERILGKETLGYLPQQLPAEDREKTVYEYFSEEEAFFEKTPKELSKLAGDFQMSAECFYEDQRMGTLSGGERIKAQLMRILLKNPTVLLLDEPSNDLDIETLEVLEGVMKSWEHSLLFISHDETLISRVANKVIHFEQVMRKTKFRYAIAKTSYEEYLKNRTQAFEHQRKQAMMEKREKQLRDERFQRVYQKVAYQQEICSRQSPAEAKNLKDKIHTLKSMERRFRKEDENMTTMPDYEEAIFFKLGKEPIPAGKVVLTYSLDRLVTPNGERILAKDIALEVRGAAKVAIIGKNGCGKTTLLNKIAEEMLLRKDIHVAYMPQNYEEQLNLAQSPVEFLNVSGDKEERTRIRTYLGSLKYTAEEMEHPMGELSGGQMAKVFLLKMSLSGANVLLLDEPTRNFSPLSAPVIRQMVKTFPGAVISVSHDRKYLEEVCDTCYRLTGEGLEYVT
ncbi:ATPase components of ABC transporters with duplicated ATPase domains [Lachnospiraceae bacterium XBB1006]|nr:ATPase components of ABC transporters with duplicated ATPase domains [Lachnospiraceae bacterium XBB1006]